MNAQESIYEQSRRIAELQQKISQLKIKKLNAHVTDQVKKFKEIVENFKSYSKSIIESEKYLLNNFDNIERLEIKLYSEPENRFSMQHECKKKLLEVIKFMIKIVKYRSEASEDKIPSLEELQNISYDFVTVYSKTFMQLKDDLESINHFVEGVHDLATANASDESVLAITIDSENASNGD